MLIGYALVIPAFLVMLFAWGEGVGYLWVGLAYLLIGLGAGMALTPAANSLTGSVPVTKVGMASGTADLQRDLGGSIMQAILGTLLTVGYATAFTASIDASPAADEVSDTTQTALTTSYSSAAGLAEAYPQYSDQIITAARDSFTQGANWAYATAAVAALLGAVLVALRYPGLKKERELIEGYQSEDADVDSQAGSGAAAA
jgi:hypothetical protein